jgi:hypothetical protein
VAQKNDGSVRCGRPGRRHDAERVESGIINHASASPCLTVVAVSMALKGTEKFDGPLGLKGFPIAFSVGDCSNPSAAPMKLGCEAQNMVGRRCLDLTESNSDHLRAEGAGPRGNSPSEWI